MTRDASPTMAEFAEMEKADPNAWWRLESGDHQNLYEEACDALHDLSVTVQLYNAILNEITALHVQGDADGHGGTSGYCAECSWSWPCPTAHLANGWGDIDACADEGWCKHANARVPSRD